MPTSSMNTMILHLRKSMCLQDEAGLTDAQLLERFIEHRDEAAFAALVRRHGSMVMGVCLRVVRNHQDAEDAFQATFLVLVRKAASISSRGLLANWLYGVAYNTALKAKASNVKRQAKEMQVTKMPDPATAGQQLWNDDLQALLDQELNRLPEQYRVPIILCDLEGKTRKEAAEQLGCPEGSLSSRLSRARVMLAKRLVRHGLAVSGGSLAAVVTQNLASASVPTSVAFATIKAATIFAAGQAANGVVPAKVAALAQGVLNAMLLSKLKIGTMWLVLSLLTFGAGFLIHQTATAQQGAVEQANENTPKFPPKELNKGRTQPDKATKRDAKGPKDKKTTGEEAAKAKEREQLQGTWRLVACTQDGQDVPGDLVKQVKIDFQGDKMQFTPPLEFHERQVEGQKGKHVEAQLGEGSFEVSFRLNPAMKPKEFDLILPYSGDKGPVVNGIYSLDNNRLRLCICYGDRPKDFSSKEGSKQVFYIMERTKPVAEPPGNQATQTDKKFIQGTWKVVAAERSGMTWKNLDGEFVNQDKTPMAFPVSLGNPNQVVFSGEQCTSRFFQGAGKTLVERAKFALDAGRRPKWITLTGKDGSLFYGIYALDGDEMRLCWQVGKRQDLRPSNFNTKKEIDPEKDTEVWVLKRQSTVSDEKAKVQKEALKPVPIKESWDGILQNRNLLKESPPEGFVHEANAWEKMWKAWRAAEQLPAIDFEKQIAIILAVPGPNKISSPELVINNEGNIKVPLPVSTLLPDDGRIGYKIIIIDLEGVNSINGGKAIIRRVRSH
jgi:RNA polymerase sigma factor (sigma-70 family)